ncbi:phage major capsid protein [Paenibacillus radicis (ex Xue et al. 2023)]|uniref:Phage major capsid protein n=1 Tax=Paenibacillus radicis (ex Xue et al. 2023) TaxID=2972489 RepID=A0ABT1YRF4_9BACL|nr:phage major capsid protein [Paenibacillus radicis (ex Xue et al. 2023)]MCR8635753.1 phage major capsid protein [Paenibacillus radicis (ex Xue et al. 2023)]
MKKTIQARLAKKEARKAELGTRSAAATDVAELRSINTELEELNSEIVELRSLIENAPEVEGEQRSQIPGAGQHEQRGTSPIGVTQIMGSYGLGGTQQQQQRSQDPVDPYGTLEYRNAFMAYAKTGEMKPELRANAMTTTSDVSAVIPTTILNEIIKKITVYGQVFSRVRKLNIKGGVDVPILSLKPTATWIGEAPASDKQKSQANTKISFLYYGLECKVSISLLADTVTLDGFEAVITDLIVEAMVKAIDLAVIKGSGTGQPKGITVDTRVPAAQIVTMTPLQFASWEQWAKLVLAKMPLAYKAGATFLMASGTFEGYINGMVDDQGQPIGRVNYGITEGPQERFGGKEVIQVEDDVIGPFADAATGDVVAVYCNLKNYGFNSNMQMTMFRYFDHDTNEWVDKAILIADGKLIDPNGIVIIKKGAAS